jgi:hypothetical protein
MIEDITMNIFEAKIGEILTCPVCGNEFKVTEDTMYVVEGGHTCSWECF